jgi:hypothetical protein
VGGLAVFLHVENADSTHSPLTRDIDIMIDREDLPRVISIAGEHGFRFRQTAGADMLLYGRRAAPATRFTCSSRARRSRKHNLKLIPRFARFAPDCMVRISW